METAIFSAILNKHNHYAMLFFPIQCFIVACSVQLLKTESITLKARKYNVDAHVAVFFYVVQQVQIVHN